MGTIHQDNGEYDKALELYNKSLAISEKLRDQLGLAKTLHNMALVYQIQLNYDKALELYNKSLAISEKLRDQSGLTQIPNSTGLISSDTRYDWLYSLTLYNIATIYYSKENYDMALFLYKKSRAISERIGFKENIIRINAYIDLIQKIHEKKIQAGKKHKPEMNPVWGG